MTVARLHDGWGPELVDPKQVKHYEILSRIGEGGMGVVYRARDTRLGRTVALKMLSGGFASDAERSHRFEREARIVSSISHPGIATVFDFDTEGESAFLTMELVEGPTLRSLLENGPVPVAELIAAAAQIAEAVAAAHQSGVVHRDLKPENIMRNDSGFYKVLDFGVARIDESEPEPNSMNTQTPTRWMTRAGMLMGTVAYMSPEQTAGTQTDARSDIFALGTILFEMATGTSPFARPTQVAMLHAIGYEPAPSLRQLRPELPEAFVRIVETCLQKDPDHRYPSAAELATDLGLLRGTTASGSQSIAGLYADRTVPTEAPKKRRRLWPWAAAAGLLVGAIATWALWPSSVESIEAPQRFAAPIQPAVEAIAPVEIPRVAVAFFENQTGEEGAEWITSGLPEMLTTDLARSQQLELIPTQRLHDLLATAGYETNAVLDRTTTAELVKWAGADIVISGAVFKLGETYRIDAQAYDVEDGSMVIAHKVSGSELFEMVEELTAGLMTGLTGDREPMPRLLAVTDSEGAFQAFSEGRGYYENLEFKEAAAHFRKSIELDQTFGQPQLHLATSLFAAGENDAGLDALRQAVQNADTLPEDEKLLVTALDAYLLQNDPDSGAIVFEKLFKRFPRHTDALVWRGRIAADVEGDPMTAIRQLREAIKIDRDYLPAVVTLAGEMSKLGVVEESTKLLRDTAERCPMAKDAIESHIESF